MMPQLGENLSAYERNCVFLNMEGKRFLDASFPTTADIDSDSRSAMVADFDRDGDEDLLVASVGGGPLRLFLNEFPRDHHRIRIDLRGTKSNRLALGSRVVAHLGERSITRDLFAANGFMGTSAAELYLGVGSAEKVDRLTVRWPTGGTQEFRDLPVDHRLMITEGETAFEVADW